MHKGRVFLYTMYECVFAHNFVFIHIGMHYVFVDVATYALIYLFMYLYDHECIFILT